MHARPAIFSQRRVETDGPLEALGSAMWKARGKFPAPGPPFFKGKLNVAFPESLHTDEWDYHRTELHNTKWTTSFFLFPDPWAARGGVLVYRLFWTCGCCVRVLVWFVCLISRSVRALSCPAVCRRGSHFGWLLDFALVCHSSRLISHGDPVKGSRMRPAPWLLTSL